jgi:hypothetical protein
VKIYLVVRTHRAENGRFQQIMGAWKDRARAADAAAILDTSTALMEAARTLSVWFTHDVVEVEVLT